MDPSFVPYRLAASYLKDRLESAKISSPTIGIICGSGLSGLSKTLEGPTLAIKYGEIPGFPKHTTVVGHKGEVVFGMLSGDVPTICFRGRFHSYEGHDMKTVVLPVLVMRCLQVKLIIVTNAAGGLNPDYNVGDVVPIADHLALPQLTGKNSLMGPNDPELGPRFAPMSNGYPQEFRTVVAEAATKLGLSDVVRKEGATYCFVSGPMYESRAECRFLRNCGGDCVGMSTVPETTAAHHCGMKVLCLSLITNKVVIDGDHDGPHASHEEVLQAVEERHTQMQSLVKEVVAVLKEKKTLSSLEELKPITLEVPSGRLATKKGGVLGIPLHCILQTAAILAVGVLIGARINK